MQLFPKIETFSCLQPTCRCSIPKICMQSHVIARGHHFAAQESKGASPDQSWVGSNKNLKIMELVEKVLFCVLNVGKQCIKETCLSGCNHGTVLQLIISKAETDIFQKCFLHSSELPLAKNQKGIDRFLLQLKYWQSLQTFSRLLKAI